MDLADKDKSFKVTYWACHSPNSKLPTHFKTYGNDINSHLAIEWSNANVEKEIDLVDDVSYR